MWQWSVEDPEVGAPTYYLVNFPENCMKIKKCWVRGGAGPLRLLDLPMVMQQ